MTFLKNRFKKLFLFLFLLIPFPLFAEENQPAPQCLIEKIALVKEMIESEDNRNLFNELGYPEYVENRYLDYSIEGRSEFIAEDKLRIKKIFTHLVVDTKNNSFPKVCFKIIDEEHGERTEECQITSWDGKTLSIFNSGRSFDIINKNGEIFEFSSTNVFDFDFQKNNLKIIEICVAG